MYTIHPGWGPRRIAMDYTQVYLFQSWLDFTSDLLHWKCSFFFFWGEIGENDWKHQNHRENPWNVLDSWISASRCYPMLSHDLQVYYHQSWKRRVAGEGAYWVLAGSQDHASMSFWASQLRDSEWLEWHLENPRMMIHDDSWWSMTYDWSRTFHMNCHIHACKMCFGVSKRKSWTPGGKWCQLGSATRSWRQHLLEQPRAPDSILWVGPFWVWPRSWSCQQHWNRWLEGIVEKFLRQDSNRLKTTKIFQQAKRSMDILWTMVFQEILSGWITIICQQTATSAAALTAAVCPWIPLMCSGLNP